MERLAAAVEEAAGQEREWDARLAAGPQAGLDFLAADPPLAHLLLVEASPPRGPHGSITSARRCASPIERLPEDRDLLLQYLLAP